MTEQKDLTSQVPREIALEICGRMRHRRWYIWNWIPLAGCWTCNWRGRICLEDPMGCRLINRNYERQK